MTHLPMLNVVVVINNVSHDHWSHKSHGVTLTVTYIYTCLMIVLLLTRSDLDKTRLVALTQSIDDAHESAGEVVSNV